MTDFEKAEFWEGLGRLYNETLALREATQGLARVAEAHSDRLDRVEIIIENGMQSHEKRMQRIEASIERVEASIERVEANHEALSENLRALGEIAQAHENRLGGTERTVEAVLEDLKRHREGLN
jgi:archaellum component FlaC